MHRSITTTPHSVTYPPSQTKEFYDALVAAVRAALAKYPSEACTIRRGADLVLNGHVTMQDGTVLVQSSSDAATTYQPNGECTCKGFQYSPSNHCSHRFAVAFYKRALHGSVPAEWLVTHSVALRDERAAAGDLAAVCCYPERLQQRALHGLSITPDGRAGLSQRQV